MVYLKGSAAFDLSLSPESSPALQVPSDISGHIGWKQDKGIAGCSTYNGLK